MTTWNDSQIRETLLCGCLNGTPDKRKEAVQTIIRQFTIPRQNPFAMQNLLELWNDPSFHECLLGTFTAETPYVIQAEAAVLLMHLTFHEEVVTLMWNHDAIRAALLSLSCLSSSVALGGLEQPGRGSARLEAITTLRNMTLAQTNKEMWGNEELQRVVIAAVASNKPDHRQYRDLAIEIMSNLLLYEANIASMQQNADACAALEAARKHIKGKANLRMVNAALGRLGLQPGAEVVPPAIVLSVPAEAAPKAEAVPAVIAPAAEAEVTEAEAELVPEVEADEVEVDLDLRKPLQDFIDLLPDENATHAISWIETASTVRTVGQLVLEGCAPSLRRLRRLRRLCRVFFGSTRL